MPKILSVATAGLHANQLEDTDHVRFPRVDFLELQNKLATTTLDYSAYDKNLIGGIFRNLEPYLRTDLYLATVSWLQGRKHPVVFAWSERAGIPYAVYKRYLQSQQRLVAMFQCWSRRQQYVITHLDLFPAMDDIVVHCTSMRDKLINLGAMPSQVKVIHYSIDQSFFSPLADVQQTRNLIMSVGESRSRDYASLFRAVDGTPLDLRIAAFGHWYAREKNSTVKLSIPSNVSMMGHLPQKDLRALYASSQFVVLPIHDVVYSAGATVALEAGSMARAIVAFRSRGIVDYIIDGETGILIDPGDSDALRDAIQYLQGNPREAKRMGENARQRIIEELNLESYVSNIANLLTQSDS